MEVIICPLSYVTCPNQTHSIGCYKQPLNISYAAMVFRNILYTLVYHANSTLPSPTHSEWIQVEW